MTSPSHTSHRVCHLSAHRCHLHSILRFFDSIVIITNSIRKSHLRPRLLSLILDASAFHGRRPGLNDWRQMQLSFICLYSSRMASLVDFVFLLEFCNVGRLNPGMLQRQMGHRDQKSSSRPKLACQRRTRRKNNRCPVERSANLECCLPWLFFKNIQPISLALVGK
jgi:hypothetical protein